MPWEDHSVIRATSPRSVVTRDDWDDARAYNTQWLALGGIGSNLILPPYGGKWRLSYSGPLSIVNIAGTNDGELIWLCADVTGSGGPLTFQHGAGNISCAGNLSIVLDSDIVWAQFVNMNGTLRGHRPT